MATLDDKLLGEKTHYYCSSSSASECGSDAEDDSVGKNEKTAMVDKEQDQCSTTTQWSGQSKNTGPKGVIQDWQKYVQLKRGQQDEESEKLFQKLSGSRTESLKQSTNDDTENFLLEYRKQRMKELATNQNKNQEYGTVLDIIDPDQFLNVVDDSSQSTMIIIHIYENNNSCKRMNEIFPVLASQHKWVRFCKAKTDAVGVGNLSINFKRSGVPAILVYQNKQLIGNFVRITDDLGEEFYEGDVENFLIEKSILSNN